MKTSRLRVIVMMLAVLALVIAACGPQATEEPTDEPTAEPTTAEVVETEEAEDTEDMEATEEATEDMADMDDEEDMEATEEATEEAADDLVDVAVAADDFSVLVAAVQEAGLEDTLRDGEFTVFAPTDEAFGALLEELGATQEELLARDDLAAILTYHVVEGTVTSDMLEAGEVTTVNGATVTVSLDDGVMVNDAAVVTADVEASNGVIHIIDSVLLPPAEEDGDDMEATEEATEEMGDMGDDEDMEATEEATEAMGDMDAQAEATEEMADMEATEEATNDLVDVAVAADDFSVLVAAVQEAGLEDTLRDGEFTVFAPTDEAFGALLEELGATQEELLARDDLAAILTYHVVEGTVTSDMLEAGEVTTVNGATVTVSLEDGVMVNDATVVTADVEASNGVIHIIDSVLLPPAEEDGDDMEATEEATEEMGDMGDDDMEATEEATEAMGDMDDGEEMTETLTYDGTYDFDYSSDYEVRPSPTVDTVSLVSGDQQVMVVGPDSYTRVIGGETFEDEADALTFYLERRGYTVGEATEMMMGIASYDISLPRRGLVGAATLVDLNNDRRAVVIETAETEDNVPGDVGAMVMDTITYIDLVDTAIAADDFNVLVAAVQAAELEETLRSGEFTVFAPTDEAFGALLEELGATREELLARDDLADILTYHVVEGSVTSDMLEAGDVTTVNSATVAINLEDGVMVNDATVVTADIEAANGVIHVIDTVLLPPPPEPEATPEATEEMADMEATEEATEEAADEETDAEDTEEADAEETTDEAAAEETGATIVRLASETPELNTLGTLVVRAGLFTALSDTDAELTVFAPTNEAFTAALDELGLTVDELVADRDTLQSILLYHVVEGEVTSDMLEAGEVTTLNGATVTISLEDGVMVNDATVVTADVQAINGVVHVIDGVLLPPSDDAEGDE